MSVLFGYKHEVMWQTLTRVKYEKAREKNILASSLIGTLNLVNIF